MARHGFLYSALKAGATASRQYAAAQRRQAAADARATRQSAALNKKLDREAQKAYVQSQEDEAASQTAEVDDKVQELSSILARSLGSAGPLQFVSLRRRSEVKPFDPGTLKLIEALPVMPVLPPLTLMQRLVPGATRRHAETAEAYRQRHADLVREHGIHDAARKAALAAARQRYDASLEAAKQTDTNWNAQVDVFAAKYRDGAADAIHEYCQMVLDANDGPEGFSCRVAFAPESKQLLVECEFPGLDVVPEESSFKYVKSKDEIVATARSAVQKRSLYGATIAQLTLRTLHQMFAADKPGHIETIVVNGYVTSIDKGTGKQVRPCLVTIRTSRDVWSGLSLDRVDPMACLKTLNASVSPSPAELVPVRPVVEFNMVDSRFIEETDSLSLLDQRPNLMDMTPGEFEALISNLFRKMGLETRLTQASRDGGVDCVAYDTRPILGGKVVIQAKRYKNTVGVSAVRDLFGTMQNEGASKGILVTTSGYGKASFEFASGKPLELLEGSQLLWLLEQHAGIKARIQVPETWNDPVPDSPESA